MGVTTWAMVEYEADDALGAAAAVADADDAGRAGADLHAGQGPRAVRARHPGRAARPAQGRDHRRGRRRRQVRRRARRRSPTTWRWSATRPTASRACRAGARRARPAVLARYGHLEDIPPSAGRVGACPGCGARRSCRSRPAAAARAGPAVPPHRHRRARRRRRRRSTTGSGTGPTARFAARSPSAIEAPPHLRRAGPAASPPSAAHPPAEVTARRPAAHERYR